MMSTSILGTSLGTNDFRCRIKFSSREKESSYQNSVCRLHPLVEKMYDSETFLKVEVETL